MSLPDLSPDEIIATLKRSSLPTIITEGKTDYRVFRKVEKVLAPLGVSLIPAGGKNSVLEIFRRRDEFSQITTAFVVDRDMWVFSGVPREFDVSEIVITDGYSIENDLYRDGKLENLLDDDEKRDFLADCRCVCQWFSHAVREHLKSNHIRIDLHPNRLLSKTGQLCPAAMGECGYNGQCDTLFPKILKDYDRYLRGKTLIAILLRQLSRQKREVKHSSGALLEFCSKELGSFMTAMTAKLYALFAKDNTTAPLCTR